VQLQGSFITPETKFADLEGSYLLVFYLLAAENSGKNITGKKM
jgi:hypothetical protein